MRQIVLDTETTGLEVDQGHRIIEVGCVELRNRRVTDNNFHQYLHPEDKVIDAGAMEVHGISMDFLADKPRFREIAPQLWNYLAGAELIIHNATFDVGFLDKEFARAGLSGKLADICTITDTVVMARALHPGQRVSLDALCRRYAIDNSDRQLHGALLDARLLADVYLMMSGGQSSLSLGENGGQRTQRSRFVELLGASDAPLRVMRPSREELQAHHAKLKKIAAKGHCLWADELSTDSDSG